ncbi:HNH endonuclease [Microbacterium profundi]|uniref:HNH endonuclease signature motif containing protein n=1 Tax=Microbacterium profundi TaxID=450380 RepID=UPI00051A45B8|nr:HNH endonuclease signature motif containing protein [Microbacterium profundi]MCE7480461.1 HNH endonuclease [Microbacterium profundi]
MRSLAEELEGIDRLLADAMGSSGAGGDLRVADDAELLDVVRVLGRVQRRLGGAVVAVTDQVVGRDQCERGGRLSTRAGCRDAAELLRRTLLVDGPASRRYVAAAGAVHREVDITSGALLPGKFPELAVALADGVLSVGGFLACTVPLMKAARIGVADRLAADAVLARFAAGLPLDGTVTVNAERAPLPTVDELAALAAHIIARLDPDGAEPSDRAGKRRRFFTIGKLRDGSVPVRGEVLPEVAAQLQKLIDSLLNPKAEDKGSSSTVRFRPSDDSGDGSRSADDRDGSGGDSDDDDWFDAKYSSSAEYGAGEDVSDRVDGLPEHKAKSPPVELADMRTHAQKRHDAFATALMVAAASGGMPTLGGAAPTLVVSVTAEDYTNRTGRARVEGTGYDVPLGAADHAGCAGGIQRVLFDDKGAIVAISTSARLFTATQRRAIVLRDRECLIPGCDVPADWCEIHHVQEHARGGPTHTSNGVPLCWHHHHTLDEGIWKIRMRNGLPEIRGPGWWDPYAKWRSPHLDYQAVDEALDHERHTEPESTWNTP